MHQPVLLDAVIELMAVKRGGSYIDGTVGAGGHSREILRRIGTEGRLLGIDRDAGALAEMRKRWAGKAPGNVVLEYGNFADMVAIAQRNKMQAVDGILLDIGFSSDQVDAAERGFSFMREGPLDMRMDRSQSLTAADMVNQTEEHTLAWMIRQYGEEPAAVRIARAIVRERCRAPIRTTTQLASIVETAKGGRRGGIHPATQTFQALRIAVNGELESLERGLESALPLLVVGGRLAVITFHSLEDRIVKNFFMRHAGRWESLQEGGQRWVGDRPAVKRITRKPRTASPEEIERNPRARSAKLRVIERAE